MSQSLDERLLEATTAALDLYGVYLGDRLGLYRALDEHGTLTVDGLARAAGIASRYAREWLEHQATTGFLGVDDVRLPADSRSYHVPDEHRGVLVDPDDPAHLAPFAPMLVGIARVLDQVADAYRDGSGVPFAAYGEDLRRGQGGINRPAFLGDLTTTWLPAMPDLHEQLQQPGARIADLCCGHGWSTIALARAYPQAEVVGVDADEPSIREAIEHAAGAGAAARFVAGDAAALVDDGPFDAVLILEALHDLARPVDVLTACRAALRPGGSVVVADERVAPSFVAPGDTLERMMYGWSITHCLPASMAEQPSAALGTVLRPARVDELAKDGGFGGAEAIDVDAGFFTIYRLR